MPECMVSLLANLCGWERIGMCTTSVLRVMVLGDECKYRMKTISERR